MDEESLKRKIRELETELAQTKNARNQTITESTLESTRSFLTDTPIHDFIRVLSTELSTAEIFLIDADAYDREAGNCLQCGRSPTLWSIKANRFGIEMRCGNNWTRPRIIAIGKSTVLGQPTAFESYAETIRDTEFELRDYVENPELYPLAQIVSLLLDWNPRDDLFFWMPAFAPVFYGIIKSTLYTYVQFGASYSGNPVNIEVIDRHFREI